MACQYCSVNIVKYLVEHGADVNKENKDGDTPLIIAWQDEEIVKYLIEHGADINIENEYGNTPLIEAYERNNQNIIKYLIKHGADVNKKNKNGDTPLMKTRINDNKKIEEYLMECEIEKRKENDYILLIKEYIIRGKENIVKYLNKNGANVNINIKDIYGDTIFIIAYLFVTSIFIFLFFYFIIFSKIYNGIKI